jgi:anti-sigma B factor antagonist
MNVKVTSLRGTPLLEMQGDIDHGTCAAVETALDAVLDQGNTIVLLDLSEIAYIDSGGICVLLSEARRLRANGWLGVINPNANVRRLLEIVGLFADPSFRAFDDRLAAEAALPVGTLER